MEAAESHKPNYERPEFIRAAEALGVNLKVDFVSRFFPFIKLVPI
jgi:hypothetical protein